MFRFFIILQQIKNRNQTGTTGSHLDPDPVLLHQMKPPGPVSVPARTRTGAARPAPCLLAGLSCRGGWSRFGPLQTDMAPHRGTGLFWVLLGRRSLSGPVRSGF